MYSSTHLRDRLGAAERASAVATGQRESGTDADADAHSKTNTNPATAATSSPDRTPFICALY